MSDYGDNFSDNRNEVGSEHDVNDSVSDDFNFSFSVNEEMNFWGNGENEKGLEFSENKSGNFNDSDFNFDIKKINEFSDKIDSSEKDENTNQHDFYDWVNPENYKDDKYVGEGQDWGYKPEVNGEKVDTSEYRENIKNQTEKLEAITAYMSEHNYGRWDFREYSQDAKWRMLMSEAYPDYELPPISKENASNNMLQYYNEKNLKSEDFEEYSKDPLWQRMYKDLYGKDFIPEKNDNTSETDKSSELQGLENVSARDIKGFDPTKKSFWDYKNTDKEIYLELAEKLPEVQAELKSGKTIEEISKNPELADCVNAYYNPYNIIKVEKHDEGLILQDDGRHRVAAAQELGNEVPVEIIDMTEQNKESQDNTTESFRSKLSDFFSNFFGKPDKTNSIEESDDIESERIENEENPEDNESHEETEKTVVETIEHMNPESLSEEDKEVIYNTSKDYILEKYGDYVPLERLENLKEDVILGSTEECRRVYEQYGGDYDKYVVGFYVHATGKIYIDVPRNGDMTEIMATVVHEVLHKASRNEETGDNGLFTVNLNGLKREDSRNINEGFTEMYAIRDMEEMGFEYESSSYVYEVYVAKQLEDIIGKDIAAEAFFTNNPELLRAEFEKSYATEEELSRLKDGDTIKNGKYSEFLSIFNKFITNSTPENKQEVDAFLDDLRRRRKA